MPQITSMAGIEGATDHRVPSRMWWKLICWRISGGFQVTASCGEVNALSR
jgi:hypothetical protein